MSKNLVQFTRRSALAAFGVAISGAALISSRIAHAGDELTHIKVSKRPQCACCDGWVDHLKANGFTATVVENPDINNLKSHLGIPGALQSCHTGEIGGYAIEGHVPAAALKRLLASRPDAIGLSVPGMPAGSPGMEGAEPVVYDVILFDAKAQSVFGRYKGGDPVAD